MNHKRFVRTLLFTCWLPFVGAAIGAAQLADNAAYAHHKSLGWETPVSSVHAEPSMPADKPTMPDASLPARYHMEGALFGFFSGVVVVVLAATVAGFAGTSQAPPLKKSNRVLA